MKGHSPGGPREKLQFHGEDPCSDEELLALIFQSGGRGYSSLDLARTTLHRCGGLGGLHRLRMGELRRIPGLGMARAGALVAAMALGRRSAERSWFPGMPFRDARQVYQRYRHRLAGCHKERFYGLLLDSKNRLMTEELVSEGTLTSSLVHPREVFGPALRDGAAALLVLHNHPSGDPRPSEEDHEVTSRLQEAGRILGLPLLDHLVIGRNGYYSFQEKGWI